MRQYRRLLSAWLSQLADKGGKPEIVAKARPTTFSPADYAFSNDAFSN